MVGIVLGQVIENICNIACLTVLLGAIFPKKICTAYFFGSSLRFESCKEIQILAVKQKSTWNSPSALV